MSAAPSRPPETIGVVPAAGLAQRLGKLPCSKEIYPIGTSDGVVRPVGQYLLERMHGAGVRQVYVVLRDGKWDIPHYFGDGAALDMDLAYLMMRRPDGPAFTVDQVYPFVRGARLVLGFPDILFKPADAYAHLLARQSATSADVVLGVFPTERPSKMDMVEIDAAGRVRAIHIKPAATRLRYAWIIAAWAAPFTEFLHEHLQALERAHPAEAVPGEVHVGRVLQAALAQGLNIEAVEFPQGRCLDIGTPEDLLRAPLFDAPERYPTP
jgi:glucose-1-phosphate thymidylyltransferase